MPNRSNQTPALEHVRVLDCMHSGILSCHADASLGEVAGIMAKHRVHSVAVTNGDRSRPMGVVSSLDVVAAIAGGGEPTALEASATEKVSVSSREPLARAARLMAEHGVAHLVVLDAASGYPVGVLSSLDIASAYAGGSRR